MEAPPLALEEFGVQHFPDFNAIQQWQRDGDNLMLVLASDESVRIEGFFATTGTNTADAPEALPVDADSPAAPSSLAALDEMFGRWTGVAEGDGFESTPAVGHSLAGSYSGLVLPLTLGVLAAAAAAGRSGPSSSPPASSPPGESLDLDSGIEENSQGTSDNAPTTQEEAIEGGISQQHAGSPDDDSQDVSDPPPVTLASIVASPASATVEDFAAVDIRGVSEGNIAAVRMVVEEFNDQELDALEIQVYVNVLNDGDLVPEGARVVYARRGSLILGVSTDGKDDAEREVVVELNKENDAVSSAEVSLDDDNNGTVGDRLLLDTNGDGTVDVILIQVFTPDGRVIRRTRIEDSNQDGSVDRIDSKTFDAQGIESTKVISMDTDDDGILDQSIRVGFQVFTAPNDRRTSRGNFFEYDTDNDGTVDWRYIIHWDSNASLLMWEEEHDTDDDGTLDRREIYTHGPGGHGGRLPLMLRLETNTDDSGTMDRIITETYSYYTAPDFRNKNTIRYTLYDGDENCDRDGTPDRMVFEDGKDIVYDPTVAPVDWFEQRHYVPMEALAGVASVQLAGDGGDTIFVITSQLLDAMADGVSDYSFTIDGDEEGDGMNDTGDIVRIETDNVVDTGGTDSEGRAEYLYQVGGFYSHFYVSSDVEVQGLLTVEPVHV